MTFSPKARYLHQSCLPTSKYPSAYSRNYTVNRTAFSIQKLKTKMGALSLSVSVKLGPLDRFVLIPT